jgi:hypothetical protein
MRRYSSRRQGLNREFINQKLKGAISYDRIAGFFRSSILEVGGEALEKVDGTIQEFLKAATKASTEGISLNTLVEQALQKIL